MEMKRNTSLPWLAVVAMGLAIAIGTPAAARTASDYPEDALKFAFVGAYRYEGAQPVDLLAKVVDDRGMPVEGATVTVQINSSASAQVRTIRLEDEGSGAYVACDAVYLNGPTENDLYTFTATMGRMQPAVAQVKSDLRNACGAGQPQIRIASAKAQKLDGKGQPLSVLVQLVDDGGNSVTGARVRVSAAGNFDSADTYLAEIGGGRYLNCNVARFDTSGAGQIGVS